MTLEEATQQINEGLESMIATLVSVKREFPEFFDGLYADARLWTSTLPPPADKIIMERINEEVCARLLWPDTKGRQSA